MVGSRGSWGSRAAGGNYRAWVDVEAKLRVMVVDDHPMWREGVARDLAEGGYEVVAAVGEGAQAIRIAGSVRPDVVVIDLQLTDRLGVEVIQGVLGSCPEARILMLSASG